MVISLSKIANAYMSKIRGIVPLAENERFGHIWKSDKQPIHAGQLISTKELPNGMKKIKLITVYANPKMGQVERPVALETRYIDRSGRIQDRGYAGIFYPNGETESLSGTLQELRKFAAEHLYRGNPDAKRL